MLYELVGESAEADHGSFLSSYRSELRAVVERVGRARAVEEGVDESTVAALMSGGGETLTVSEASAVLALQDSYPDAETIRQESLDHLLLGMTTAVLDVETVAANLALDLSPTEVQQRIEGRADMSIVEYAHVHALLAERNSW